MTSGLQDSYASRTVMSGLGITSCLNKAISLALFGHILVQSVTFPVAMLFCKLTGWLTGRTSACSMH